MHVDRSIRSMTLEEKQAKRDWGTGACQVRGCTTRAAYLVLEASSGESGSGLLTVADQGPGMTKEQASHVFERFYRTDDARTRASGCAGLGLAIAAALATAHGGELTVDTQPGRGAAFHLRLPQAETFQVTAN